MPPHSLHIPYLHIPYLHTACLASVPLEERNAQIDRWVFALKQLRNGWPGMPLGAKEAALWALQSLEQLGEELHAKENVEQVAPIPPSINDPLYQQTFLAAVTGLSSQPNADAYPGTVVDSAHRIAVAAVKLHREE